MFSVINRTYPFIAVMILALFLYSHFSGEKIFISKYFRTPQSPSVSSTSDSEVAPPVEKQKEAIDVVYKKESPETASVPSTPEKTLIEKLEVISPVNEAHYEHPHNEIIVKWRGKDAGHLSLVITDLLYGKEVERREVFGDRAQVTLPYPSKFQITVSRGYEKVSRIVHFKAPIAEFDSRFPFLVADVQGEKRFKLQYKANFPLQMGVLKAYRDSELKTLIGNYPLNEKGQVFKAKRQGQYCFKIKNLGKNPYIMDSNPLCFSLIWDSRPQKETAIAKVAPKKTYKTEMKVAKIPVPKQVQRAIASVPEVKNIPQKKLNLDQIMTYYKIEGKDTYQFKLPLSKDAQMYHVQIFRDSEGHDLYKEITVKGHRVNWRTNIDEKMYYRYRIKNQNGTYGEFSDLGILRFPISPYDI